jgi:hypothetical protein
MFYFEILRIFLSRRFVLEIPSLCPSPQQAIVTYLPRFSHFVGIPLFLSVSHTGTRRKNVNNTYNATFSAFPCRWSAFGFVRFSLSDGRLLNIFLDQFNYSSAFFLTFSNLLHSLYEPQFCFLPALPCAVALARCSYRYDPGVCIIVFPIKSRQLICRCLLADWFHLHQKFQIRKCPAP